MGAQMGDPFAGEEQLTLRSDLRGFIWIGRVGRPDALYYASLHSGTSEKTNVAITNPIDFEEIDGGS